MHLILVLIILLTDSCRPDHSGTSSKITPENTSKENKETKYPKVFSAAQEIALDALNELQMSTDEQNRIYSTFAGIDHPCYHSDTLLRMTQGEFLLAMKQFVESNCKRLPAEHRNRLAKDAVKAQDEYTVMHCREKVTDGSYEMESYLTGTWVIPNLLGRRDVVIVW